MAQTDFMLTQADVPNMVSEILDRGAFLVPDLRYKEPAYTTLMKMDDFYSLQEIPKLFLIIHKDWSAEPLYMSRVVHNRFGIIYSVRQREGGPAIIFYCSGGFVKDKKRYVGSGFLNYHTKYWSPMANDMLYVPEELKKFYRSLSSAFKKNAVAWKGKKRTYWASADADKKLLTGELELNFTFLSRRDT